MTEPDKLTQRFAESGDYEDIPDSSSVEGRASLEEGFPVETQTPLTAGGIPPNRLDFNGILRRVTEMLMWVQQGGQWSYETNIDYVPSSLVAQNDVLYYCLADNGPSSTVVSPEDDDDGTYWKVVIDASGDLNVKTYDSASTTAEGLVELATQAETFARSSSSLAVTPDSLNGLVSLTATASMVPLANTSGKITNWVSALQNSSGKIESDLAGTADVATKLGTSTVGSGVKLWYLASGVPTASSSTVGSGTKFVYLSSGTLTTSSSTVGSSTTPIFLSSGTFTACSSIISSVISTCKFTDPGYVKFANGLIVQWGTNTYSTSGASLGRTVTFTFPIAFPTACLSCVAVAGCTYNGSITGSSYSYSFFRGFTTTKCKVLVQAEHLTDGFQHTYIAVGY